MSDPYTEVSAAFDNAAAYAAAAQTQLDLFAQALNSAIFAPPSVSTTWNDLAPPTLDSIGPVPDLVDIVYTTPSPAPANTFTPQEATVTFSDFVTPDPTVTYPLDVVVSYPANTPTVPAVADVAVPPSPTLTFPPEPTLLAINTVTMGAIDLHPEYLANLDTIPTLTLLAPTPYSFALGPEYASVLLSDLQTKLFDRLQGGTGLTPAVEAAIWDRARDRETVIAQKNIDEIQRTHDALGFQLPSGTMAAQLREAEQEYYDKVSALSRDIAIKQAELEQANLKQTIDEVIALEGKLIDYSYQMEQLAFQSAKQYADNAVQIYNAGVEEYKALISAYNAYALNYKTIIEGEMAKVEIYKGELQGELTKSQMNTALIQQYKTTIDAQMSYVEIYKAQVSAAQTLVSLEATKINAAAESIRAYTAQINAETAKVENYKAQVQAQGMKVETFKAQVQAYAAKVAAESEESKAYISRDTLRLQGYQAAWDAYKAKIMLESAKVDALGKKSVALIDGFRAGAAATEANAKLQTGVWETQIKQYELSKQLALNAGKINADSIIATNAARLDAAKAGAQVYAQLTASSYAMIHAQASISGGAMNSVNYSYGGEVAGTVTPIPIL